ncbi:hypothetical protein C9994_04330 [Marivirga lumbricoides]|uniref:Uncharacterized protein n=1 Tax=Marivirga lumbricoides TaxID=1046115 RepID=A0A2T4DTG8_9BACT|nr:hypothetical protein C9994_04330 [Marivirga lumbricoides]
MQELYNLNNENKMRFTHYNFLQTLGIDNGMHKIYQWTNKAFIIGLYYDRGYFDCRLVPLKEPANSLSLIPLLRFIKRDSLYYKKELKEFGAWNTLNSNDYLNLIFEHYTDLEKFFFEYNMELLDEKKKSDESSL